MASWNSTWIFARSPRRILGGILAGSEQRKNVTCPTQGLDSYKRQLMFPHISAVGTQFGTKISLRKVTNEMGLTVAPAGDSLHDAALDSFPDELGNVANDSLRR